MSPSKPKAQANSGSTFARPQAGPPSTGHAETALPAVVPPAVRGAASAYAELKLKPPEYDPAAAKALVEALLPRLMALPADELLVPRLDVRAAALAALGVYTFATQSRPLYQRFEKLASIGEFELRNLEDLKALSFGVLYAYSQAEAAGSFKSDARVPVELIQEGMALEARMQELCEYKFKRDPQIAPLVAGLRPGSGYRDLAGDLNGYADIYELRPAEVSSDSTNYRPTDVKEARRIAGEILSHLSLALSPQARAAYELLQRLWTLLLEVYFEVREVGRSLLRHDAKVDEWFPSLFAAGRAGRPRKKKPAEPVPGSGPAVPDPA